MILVILESPYSGTEAEVKLNVEYARKCIRDCLERGESPIASHLLYTQPGILEDDIEKERQLGIKAGLDWYRAADLIVLYIDRGVSKGMKFAIKRAAIYDLEIDFRRLEES